MGIAAGPDGPSEPAKYVVRTVNERRPVAGTDSCITLVPEGLYLRVPGQAPALNLRALGRLLRQISEEQAAAVGEVLHHAEWVITSDPVVVERIGMHGDPGCRQCRAGVDQALGHLVDRGGELLVGALYWAGRG